MSSWQNFDRSGCQPGTRLHAYCLAGTLIAFASLGAMAFGESDPSLPLATNILELHQIASGEQNVGCAVRLEGIVLWTNPAKDRLISKDDSGAMTVAMDLRTAPTLRSGQRVMLEGKGVAGRGIY